MARVFVAEETRFGRRVVVKVLAPALAPALSPERFERELAACRGSPSGALPWPTWSSADTTSLSRAWLDRHLRLTAR